MPVIKSNIQNLEANVLLKEDETTMFEVNSPRDPCGQEPSDSIRTLVSEEQQGQASDQEFVAKTAPAQNAVFLANLEKHISVFKPMQGSPTLVSPLQEAKDQDSSNKLAAGENGPFLTLLEGFRSLESVDEQKPSAF